MRSVRSAVDIKLNKQNKKEGVTRDRVTPSFYVLQLRMDMENKKFLRKFLR